MLKYLNPKEFQVLRLSYGLDCDKMSAKEIAEVLREEIFPNLKMKIIKPPESFYKDRPSSIPMVSTELSTILGRPQRSLREAIRMEFA